MFCMCTESIHECLHLQLFYNSAMQEDAFMFLIHYRFAKMLEPLMDRRAKLERTKRLHQFLRDIEDEKIWIAEKMLLAESTNYGNSLLSVQMLQKKNKSLRNEIDSHEPRIISVVDLGLSMIEEGHPQSDKFQELINDLNARWGELLEAVESRKNRLELSEQTQQVNVNCYGLKHCINYL